LVSNERKVGFGVVQDDERVIGTQDVVNESDDTLDRRVDGECAGEFLAEAREGL